MTAVTATGGDGSARLARDLLRRATGALSAIPADAQADALSAIDAFVACPVAATYLAAVRVLAGERRRWALQQVRQARAGYARARGLDTVRRELGVGAADLFAALPVDDRAGLRLRSLALLAAAHRELAGRVAGSAELMRKQLEQARARDRTAPAAPPRRRTAPTVRPSRRKPS